MQLVVDAGVKAQFFDGVLALLRAARNARPGQFIDQRTTVAGNALLLSALAEAALHPGGERFKPAAQNLKAVCCNRFVDDNFKVRASGLWQDRPLPAAPSLLDHALLIQALLDCHALAPEPTALPRLSGLMETVRAGFADDGTGFYRVNPPSTLLPVDRPPYPFSDTAVPAANAVMAANLRRLFDLTGNQTYDLRRQSLITSFLSHRNPTLTGHTFSAEIAIAQPNRSK